MKSSGKQLKQIDWNQTYNDCYRAVRAVIGKLVGFDHNYLDDMISEAFEKGIINEHQFDPGKANIKTWLCTIGRNVALQSFRNKEVGIIPGVEILDEIDEDFTEEKKVLYSKMMKAIDSFDDDDICKQTFFELLNGMSYDEIAERDGCWTSSVRGRVKRFLDKLRKELSKHPEFKKYKKNGNFASILKQRDEKYNKKPTALGNGIYNKGNRFFVYGKKNGKTGYIGSFGTFEEAQKAKEKNEKEN